MSEENLEVVRQALRAFAVRDFATFAAHYAVATTSGWPQPSGDHRFEYSIEFEREATAADWVVLQFLWITTEPAGDIRHQLARVGAFRLQDAKIIEQRSYWTWDEAIADLGLSS